MKYRGVEMEIPFEMFSFLENRSGMVFDEDKKEKLALTLDRRIRSADFGSIDPYFDFIKSGAGRDELSDLISAITVGETYFFRDTNQWKAFNTVALPAVAAERRKKERRLRIWSAGCSTGEEPYTVAICLIENLPFVLEWDVKILATDINPEAIKKAKKGIFTGNSFRGGEEEYIGRHFHKTRKGYRVRNHVRGMVEFRRMNIVSPNGYPRGHTDFDIIFCRNMLMYYRPDICKKTVRDLIRSLKQNGYLFLGHAEGSSVKDTDMEPVYCCDTFIYRKSEKNSESSKSAKPLKRRRIHKPRVKVKEHALFSFVKSRKNAEKRTGGAEKNTIRLPEAWKNWRPAEIKGEDASKLCYEKALACYFREDFRAAMHEISKENGKRRRNVQGLILKGLISINTSDFDVAGLCHRQALEISNILPEVHMLGAMIMEARKDYAGAIAGSRTAIFLDRDFFIPWFRMGHIHQTRGEPEKSRRDFENALRVLDRDDRDRIRLFTGGISNKTLETVCRRRCGK